MPLMANHTEQDKVRELQVKLFLAAKRSPTRRFHALWDRIHRMDVLERAWRQVRENRGAAGVDRTTIAQIEGRGVDRFLAELEVELREQRLGFHHRMVESFGKPGFRFLARWPSADATQAARQRIRELTDRRLLLLPVEDVVANLNRFLTGWAGYFRRGNSTVQFHKLDLYVAERLARWIGKRHQAQRPLAYGFWRLRQERFLGLRPLVGRVHRGAAQAAR